MTWLGFYLYIGGGVVMAGFVSVAISNSGHKVAAFGKGVVVLLFSTLWPILWLAPVALIGWGYFKTRKRLAKLKRRSYVTTKEADDYFEKTYGPDSDTPMEAADLDKWRKALKADHDKPVSEAAQVRRIVTPTSPKYPKKGMTEQQIREAASKAADLPGPVSTCPSCEKTDAGVMSDGEGMPTFCLHCGWDAHGQNQNPVAH